MLISLVVFVPVLVVVSSVFRDSGGAWAHLAETRLSDYLINTLLLAISVPMIAAVLGVPTAWLVTMYRFPGRGILSWALLLPIAMPAYIAAYSLTDLLQRSGPIQSCLFGQIGPAPTWFPEVRSLPGAAVVLGLSLYPYVYFAARVAFASQPRSALEASRSLGRGPVATFLTVGIPMARPALIAALLLVLMETVADFGAVEYCAVDTLATGVYRTWFGLDSQNAAAQLSTLLLGVVGFVFMLEVINRGHRRFHHTSIRGGSRASSGLGRIGGVIAAVSCTAPILLGFAAPAAWLVVLAWQYGDPRAGEVLLKYGANSALIGGLAAAVAVASALICLFAHRAHRTWLSRSVVHICRAGYGLPGPVIAIGVLVTISWLDARFGGVVLIGGTLAALLIGYQARFLSVAIGFVGAAYERINDRIDDAAHTLGSSRFWLLARVHLPLLRGGILAAAALVFVDAVKELPMTLMLRPFNFDTLAVRVYQLASEERLEAAASGSLLLVLVGLIPAAVLATQIDRRPGGAK